jgi:hypothetical protein
MREALVDMLVDHATEDHRLRHRLFMKAAKKGSWLSYLDNH